VITLRLIKDRTKGELDMSTGTLSQEITKRAGWGLFMGVVSSLALEDAHDLKQLPKAA
jgi:hypothetical protein